MNKQLEGQSWPLQAISTKPTNPIIVLAIIIEHQNSSKYNIYHITHKVLLGLTIIEFGTYYMTSNNILLN